MNGWYDVEPRDFRRWIDAIDEYEGPPREGTAERAQQQHQQAQIWLLVAQAQLHAGLERDAAMEMVDSMMEQLQLDVYVAIAP